MLMHNNALTHNYTIQTLTHNYNLRILPHNNTLTHNYMLTHNYSLTHNYTLQTLMHNYTLTHNYTLQTCVCVTVCIIYMCECLTECVYLCVYQGYSCCCRAPPPPHPRCRPEGNPEIAVRLQTGTHPQVYHLSPIIYPLYIQALIHRSLLSLIYTRGSLIISNL